MSVDVTQVIIHRYAWEADRKWEVEFARDGETPIVQIFQNDPYKPQAIENYYIHQGWTLTISEDKQVHTLKRLSND